MYLTYIHFAESTGDPELFHWLCGLFVLMLVLSIPWEDVFRR